MNDGSSVLLSGKVHVTSQALKTPDGDLIVSLYVNIANLEGLGDDSTAWIAVGADQLPPSPVFPPDPVQLTVPFDMISLDNQFPPDPVMSPVVRLSLVFDADGNLFVDQTSAQITGRVLR